MKSKQGFDIVLSLTDNGQHVAKVTRTYKHFKDLDLQLRELTRFAPILPSKFDKNGFKFGTEELRKVLENYLNEALAVTAVVKSQALGTFFGLKCNILDAAFNVDEKPINNRDSINNYGEVAFGIGGRDDSMVDVFQINPSKVYDEESSPFSPFR